MIVAVSYTHLDVYKRQTEVKAILLKSEGEKAFCGGASFDELLEIQDLETSKKFFGGFAKVLNAMRTCGKIVVVRVQGKTTGGGVAVSYTHLDVYKRQG